MSALRRQPYTSLSLRSCSNAPANGSPSSLPEAERRVFDDATILGFAPPLVLRRPPENSKGAPPELSKKLRRCLETISPVCLEDLGTEHHEAGARRPERGFGGQLPELPGRIPRQRRSISQSAAGRFARFFRI